MKRDPIRRVEPMLSSAFINRDFVNQKDKMLDLTPPSRRVVMSTYDLAACWVVCGFLVMAVVWLGMNW